MPQLHDSSNRHATSAQPSAYVDGCARIFGLETEYGLSSTGMQHPIDASHLAMTMFRPILLAQRSTNTYTVNGSRLYVDVGAHPEYATAEARTPYDAMLVDAAGEMTIRNMALQAQRELRAHDHSNMKIHVFKNNADSAGHSFGCHENYLVRRNVPLAAIQEQLLPFLITRQIYTGSGKFDGTQWTYTQRAQFVDETVSSATTRSRPMINTRDEPHADPESFRRLHVIIGDSNRSQWATIMKCATTHIVLCAMEWEARTGQSTGLSRLHMANPIEANLAVNERGPAARIALADGTTMSALAMQQVAWECVHTFIEQHRHEVVASLQTDTGWGVERVLDEWQWVLARLANEELDALAHVVDWACKRQCFDQLMAHRSVEPVQIAQLDLDYHDIANGRLYQSLVQRGVMRTYATEQQISEAVCTPPPHTRAVLRGMFVQHAQQSSARTACDWTQLQIIEPVKQRVSILDPFDDQGSDAFYEMIALLDQLTLAQS